MAPAKGPSMVERLRAFQRSNQANKRCANCPERGPTYICLDFQTFVCQTCSGLHREFGHKIKSISLSEWTSFEVEHLEAGGNERAALMWMNRWSEAEFPEPDSSNMDALRVFIKMKFVEKRWFRPMQRIVNAAAAAAAAAASAPVEVGQPPAAPATETKPPVKLAAPGVADLLSDGPSHIENATSLLEISHLQKDGMLGPPVLPASANMA